MRYCGSIPQLVSDDLANRPVGGRPYDAEFLSMSGNVLSVCRASVPLARSVYLPARPSRRLAASSRMALPFASSSALRSIRLGSAHPGKEPR